MELVSDDTGSDMELVSDDPDHSYSPDTDKEPYSDLYGIEVESKNEGIKSPNDTPLYMIQSSNSVYEAPIIYKEHLLAVCAYVSRHNCSDTQFRDLLALLNLHVPANNLVETEIDKVKSICGFDKDFLKFRFYCSTCKKVLMKT